MGKQAPRRLLELETLAMERASRRERNRDLLQARSNATPGGILGGPGFDAQAEELKLEIEEGGDRLDIWRAEAAGLQAQLAANRALVVAIVFGIVNLTATILVALL